MSAGARSLGRGAVVAAALAAVGCAGDPQRASDSAYADSLRRTAEAAVPAAETPPQASAERWALHVDSLERADAVRVLVARIDPESDDSWAVEGAYVGDSLVRVRGDLPADSVGMLTYYLRDGRVVLVTASPPGGQGWVPGRTNPPPPTARYYTDADTIVAQRGSVRGVDSRVLAASFAALRAPLAGMVSDAARSDSTAPRPVAPYVVHAVCPFECCQYGEWTVISGAVLRATQSVEAPVVGRVAPGAKVMADSGVVIVDTIGVVTVSGALTDIESGRTFAGGDTVLLLDYQGEGFRGAWLRGHVISVSDFWSATGANGAKLLRSPHTLWWTHMTVPQGADTLRGWANMSNDSVHVSGSDSCG